MTRSGKLHGTVRSVAVPLLLSFLVHGFLLLGLWLWPLGTQSPTLTIQSTRISIDTCVFDSPASTLLAERELPAELLGPGVDTALAPRIEGPPPSPMPKRIDPASQSSSTVGKGSADRDAKGSEQGSIPTSGGGRLFPFPAKAASVVYVLDHSLSMGGRKLAFALRELIASLRQLPAGARFQVIAYNDSAVTLIVNGQKDLLPAEPEVVAQAVAHLQDLGAAGNSNHVTALRSGIDLRPDVLYFLTDADNLQPAEVALLTQRNQRTAIHTIELTHRRVSSPEGPLARLAHDNRGTYRRVSISD